MAHSSLLGIDEVPGTPPGHDTEALGPSDTSDSGSDVAGLEDDSDPAVPVDVALRADRPVALPLGESTAAAEDGDAGVRDGADIGVDRVFIPGETELDEEAAQATLSLAGTDGAEDEEDEEGEELEEDEAQPARKAAGRRPLAPREAGDATDEDLPGETDPAERRPGRD